MEQAHRDARTLLSAPEGATVIEVINTMVDDALNQRCSVEDALARGAARVDEIFRDAGYYG